VTGRRLGRGLSAAGGILLAAGLFATWYHVTRPDGLIESASGFDTFPRLRAVVLLGAAALLVTSVVPRSRPVPAARALIGVVLGLLILRRIVFPPDIADPIATQFGAMIPLVGAITAVFAAVAEGAPPSRGGRQSWTVLRLSTRRRVTPRRSSESGARSTMAS
jgi:peptidoglycan/LPS O-acetylase OafA/YrhL